MTDPLLTCPDPLCSLPLAPSCCRSAGQTMDMEEVLRLGTGMVSGLAHMHRRGVVHCDVKPANMMLRSGACLVSPGCGSECEGGGSTEDLWLLSCSTHSSHLFRLLLFCGCRLGTWALLSKGGMTACTASAAAPLTTWPLRWHRACCLSCKASQRLAM